ncbi:disks large-associated protein 5 [Salarias fasciatus]|uniref:disks large-associated protein 5 n=1 Tax=Salarias fasciatus TaxID=181472 RepID=UPI001176840B|nr:disks large-associated protein 5 [Salarias fasciatus]
MESRFAHLRQRDTSVSMLRTKMSRRRSQSQKENRERTVNTRRQLRELDQIPETKPAPSKGEDRMKQLECWKERKALEKEKAKREKEGKGVFKTGLYHPKDTLEAAPLPDVPGASARAKGKKVDLSQSTRVTRSTRQQPLKMEDPNITRGAQQIEKVSRTRIAPVKPAAAKTNSSGAAPALSTRSAKRPPARAAPPEKTKPAIPAAGGRVTRSRATGGPVAPSAGRGKSKETVQPAVVKDAAQVEAVLSEVEEVPPPPAADQTAGPQEEDMAVDPAPPADPAQPSLSSFAPAGFVFQAPVGLAAFKFEPMTPRSADAFLTPSPSFVLPPAPVFTDVPQAEPSPPAPCSSQESEHDVPYFRSEIARETERLTALSLLWESKVEDESIPEDMRDGMRTAVGQARLLMKERFGQFAGLVDDCELGRGDRVTTCSDLQGFWDMVHYQVEDVGRKFDALKEAEGRGWAEEHRPPPRQRKAVKKPSAAPAKPAAGRAAAAKSRLAAVKAAMKARQQAAEAEPAGKTEDEPEPSPEEARPGPEVPAQDGGFFKLESPAKPPGPLRRSSRLSAAVLPQQSPCSTPSPRRVTRRSLALARTPARTPARVDAQTPAQLPLVLQQTPGPESQVDAPQGEAGPGSLCFSPVSEALSDDAQPEGGSAGPETVAAPGLSTPKPALPTITVVEAADGRLRQSPLPAAENAWSRPPQWNSHPASTRLPGCERPAFPGPHSRRETLLCCQDLCIELPGLDFERYLQPSLRGSLSPRAMDSPEMWSPTATDISMESPRGQREEPTPQETPEPSSLSSLQPPQVQTAEAAMLLFTPDMSDRIRQSVCPSDLMVFTPPI